jgi:hypothetical protein
MAGTLIAGIALVAAGVIVAKKQSMGSTAKVGSAEFSNPGYGANQQRRTLDNPTYDTVENLHRLSMA